MKTGKRVLVHVGTPEDMGQRFTSAWHRAAGGERVRETHVTFPDLPALLHALTPKRLELLRALHAQPAPSIKALAERLGRDYKRVHEDIETLTESGLIDRKEGNLRAPYDAITAEMRM